MNSFDFWQKWLFTAGIIMVVFGVALALGYGSPLFGWLMSGINSTFWANAAQMTPAMLAYQLWMVGLLGTVMACWGLTVAFIAFYPFRRMENWAWTCLASGVGLWFVLDESLSLFYRVYFNAIFNLGFLLMLVLPLVFTMGFFRKSLKK
jgi:hypothetical protein